MSNNTRKPAKPSSATALSRRRILQGAGAASTATALGIPLILVPPRAQAATELNMIAWYGHGEPDMVEAFEAKHNVKIKAKYYAGGDNMLALISQSPPGTYDIILSDAEFVQLLNEAGYIEKMDPNFQAQLSPLQQQQLMQEMEKMQMKDSLT